MKMKTHKGASKRFAKTGSGKIVRRKAGKRHLLSHKKRDRKRRLSGAAVVVGRATAVLNQLLSK
ncbi:50S ribosomal protein L35 [Candidatus Nitrospira inopinata]|jgi:large subunit ribosomal protein L35|uniref:Large ribosomal subunit protein bL35 n=1 Tax=Candidatus Nitrospira inopinata TaxID=1715989 RepID=A0A0S4KX79_9BACT|nr:50S ribosomal protein L35 [Candidatus Nitrospira inopinata]CUQ66242.1 50S ribosomal protein L35 [Candidatus Nitrospira inopinata]